MLISLQWINSMLSGDDLDPATASATLTALGLEVDGVERVGQGLEALVVGEVKQRAQHPNADRLSVVKLFDGAQTLDVVCGASNVPDPGGKVAFAPVGARLPGDFEIGAREIRGVHSSGMICSEAELDIGPDESGIIVLPSDWAAGDRLVDRVPGIQDHIIEISLTPNRPDALGHVGVARDLAARLGRELTATFGTLPDLPVQDDLVTLDAPDRCGRYHGVSLTGGAVGPSPLWMRVRLHRLALRPISNLVDITNFVLMEWGQPLHAFDRARLDGERVVVRMARNGEPMTTLDDQALELSSGDLVIADGSRPQALAGVMGGAESAVSDDTTELLLEAAWFQPGGVRRTARAAGLHTDSSHRFERGVDHGAGLEAAATRALELIQELTGAHPTGRKSVEGELPGTPDIPFRTSRCDLLLGMPVPPDEAATFLTRLGVSVDRSREARWVCRPPTHRPDLEREVDLIEEVMRMHGLDDLPATPSIPSEPPRLAPTRGRSVLKERVTDALRDAGLHQMMSWVFQDGERLGRVPGLVDPSRWVKLANPMRAQTGTLRPHMLPGLLDAVALNVARHPGSLRLFEVGRVYWWPEGERPVDEGPTADVDRRLPREPGRAAYVLTAGRSDAEMGARDAVGVALDVLQAMGLPAGAAPGDVEDGHLHPGVRARIVLEGDGETVGSVGEVHPDLLRAWDVPEGVGVYYGELHLDALPDLPTARYREIPRFPSVRRDLSLEAPLTVPASTMVAALRHEAASATSEGDDPVTLATGDAGEPGVEVIEDYRGKGVPAGARALLLRLHYRAAARSVTDQEVDELHEKVVAGAVSVLTKESGGDVRRR